MELLDRYLEAVRRHLPYRQQQDLLAELRSDLESQLDDYISELGHPLTPAEEESWIRTLDAPVRVAARYQSQQYLIGPPLFPIYRLVLRTVTFWVTLIYLIVGGCQVALGPFSPARLAEMLIHLPLQLCIYLGIVTLIFALLEMAGNYAPGRFSYVRTIGNSWSIDDLPKLQSVAPSRPRTLAAAIAEVVFGFLFLLWWLLVPACPFLLLGPGLALWDQSPYALAPVLLSFYWAVTALNAVQLLWRFSSLLRGTWRQLPGAIALLYQALGLIPVLLLARAPGHIYLLLKHPDTAAPALVAQLAGLNGALQTAFSVLTALLIVLLLLQAGREWLRWRSNRATSV